MDSRNSNNSQQQQQRLKPSVLLPSGQQDQEERFSLKNDDLVNPLDNDKDERDMETIRFSSKRRKPNLQKDLDNEDRRRPRRRRRIIYGDDDDDNEYKDLRKRKRGRRRNQSSIASNWFTDEEENDDDDNNFDNPRDKNRRKNKKPSPIINLLDTVFQVDAEEVKSQAGKIVSHTIFFVLLLQVQAKQFKLLKILFKMIIIKSLGLGHQVIVQGQEKTKSIRIKKSDKERDLHTVITPKKMKR